MIYYDNCIFALIKKVKIPKNSVKTITFPLPKSKKYNCKGNKLYVRIEGVVFSDGTFSN